MIVVHGYKEPKRCRIKEGLEDAGKEGWCYGHVNLGLSQWAIILWDNENDPSLHKVSGLEARNITWRNL